MFNLVFGFILFLISIITFTLLTFTGLGAVAAGHFTLAILFVCMVGMWLGAYFVANA